MNKKHLNYIDLKNDKEVLDFINEIYKGNDPLKLWNLNCLLFSLTKTTNLGDKHLCSVFANDYLGSLSSFTKSSLVQRYPDLIDTDIIFALLAQSNPSLNPNVDNSTILDYLARLDCQRMDDHSRVITQDLKDRIASAFIKCMENTAQNAHLIDELLIEFGFKPSKKNLIDLFVEENVISWNSLVDPSILDISVLGVLQESITQFYSTHDIKALDNALDIVSNNKNWFKVTNHVQKFNQDVDFEWVGSVDNMKSSCVTPGQVNFLRTNIVGLDVLVHTLVYQTTRIYPPLDQEIGLLLSKAKADPLVWERMTESVQFNFHNLTHSNYIDHIQVPKNLKK